MKQLLIFLFSVSLLSCTTLHSGVLTGNNVYPNQKIVDTAIGTEKATYVFGIGGNNKDALVYNAKRNLYKNFPLKKDQVYSNFTIDFKNSFRIVYFERKVIVSADIVTLNNDFSEEDDADIVEQKQVDFKSKKSVEKPKETKNPKFEFFEAEDLVVVYDDEKYVRGTITSVADFFITVQLKDRDNILETKNYGIDKVFLIDDKLGLEDKIGEIVFFEKKLKNGTMQKTEGKISGIGKKSLLMEYKIADKVYYDEVLIVR